MQEKKIYVKIVVNLLLTIIGFVLLILLGPRLLRFFFPFVIAYLISMIANPLVRIMERKIRIVRKHSSAIIIIAVLFLIFGLLYFVGVILVKELYDLTQNLPDIVASFSELMGEVSRRLLELSNRLPSGLRAGVTNIGSNLEQYMTKLLDGIEVPSVIVIGGYVKNVANGLFMTIITILATYFFIAEREILVKISNCLFPESVRSGYHMVADNFKNAVGGYFKAQFKIMVILLIIMFVGFELLQVNYSFLLALGIAFLDFLPIFGTGAVFWPWAVIDVITGNYLRAVFIFILYLVCLLVKQLLQPKMVGDSIGISPLSTLIFMFVGYRVSGIIGLILGIPIGMVLINFYRLGMFDRIIRGLKIIFTDINEFRKY